MSRIHWYAPKPHLWFSHGRWHCSKTGHKKDWVWTWSGSTQWDAYRAMMQMSTWVERWVPEIPRWA